MSEAQAFTRTRIQGGVREKLPHDSGAKHVAGEAFYIDDIVEPLGCLHVVAAKSTIAGSSSLMCHRHARHPASLVF